MAFGFEQYGEIPPSVQLRLNNAADVIGQSQQLINQNLTQRWADAAVNTDSLVKQIGQNLGGRLMSVMENTAQLQQPIATQLIGTLGEVYGQSIPLGANLTTPDQAAAPPACVQIRTAAAVGDFGPALECYRSTAYPQRFTRGAQYTQAVNFILDALPPDQNIRDNFANMVLQLQNQVEQPEIAFATGEGTQTTLAAPPGSIPPPEVQTTTINPPQSTILPAVSTAPSSTGGILPSCAQLAGKSYDDAVGLIGEPGVFHQVGSINGVPWGYRWDTIGPYSSGGCGAVVTPIGITGLGTITCLLSSCPAPLIPPMNPPPEIGAPTPETPTPPPAPGSTFRPETPKIPPPPPKQDCIKICPTEQPSCKYQLVCSSDHILYIIKDTDKPRSTFDRVIASGDPGGWNIDQLAQSCQIRAPQPSEQPPTSSAPTLPMGRQAGCDNLFNYQEITSDLPSDFFARLLEEVRERANLPAIAVGGITGDIVKAVINAITWTVGPFIDTLAKQFALTPLINCTGTPQESGIIIARLITGIANRYLTGAAENADTSLAYAQNSICPFKILTPGEATSAWLANEIDQERLRCIVEANGNRWDSWFPLADGSRAKLNALQYGLLWQRDKLSDAELASRLREQGYIRDYDAQNVKDLLKQIPPPSDLVRMMVRDAADEELVRTFRLDDQFTDKFTGRVEEWARQQGIDPAYMRFLWRSHWSIPSPGQLADMLHRLSRLDQNDPAYVDLQTIRTALVQQDIAPFWVDKFIATSYRPLTRIDARRAYENGAIDDQGLIEAYLNLGYNQSNAEVLLNFNKVQAALKFARHPAVKQYAKGELNGAELDDTLKAYGASPESIGFARLQGTQAMKSLRRRQCLTSLRRRLLQGEIDLPTTLELVKGQGLDEEQAQSLTAGWECEKEARGKSIPAGELCGLYAMGAITIDDLALRLQRLGYEYDDAVLLARKCAKRVNDKITAEEQKRLRQQEADQRRYISQSLRNTARDERARQAAIRNGQRLQKLKLAQTKRIQEAAVNFAKNADVDLPTGVQAVETLIQAMLDQTLYTRDEIIQAVLVESRSPKAASLALLTEAVAAALPV